MYLSSEKKTLRYQQYESKTVQKELIVITVATTDNFRNTWKPSHAIDTFRGEQR